MTAVLPPSEDPTGAPTDPPPASGVRVDAHPDANVTVLVTAEVGPEVLADLGAALAEAFHAGCASAVVDFTGAGHVPSTCVGVLNRAASVAAANGGTVTVRGVAPFDAALLAVDAMP